MLLVAAALGVVVLAIMTGAQLVHLGRGHRPAPIPPDRPLLSVLKPLKGADPGLEENLVSFFRQSYPSYELLFGVQDPQDPAVAVVERVMAAHPGVSARLVVSCRQIGFNPKVNNLANVLGHARGDAILISDSNVRVRPGYLTGLVTELLRPGVRLVSSPFRGTGHGSLGAVLESLQLNTYVLGGTVAVHRLWGGVCVVGKSMMLRRADLEAIGGLKFLARYLAEDQVCGQEIARLGGRLSLAPEVVDNMIGRPSVGRFLSRHMRWASIRWRIAPAGYLGELLLNPTAFALAAVAAHPGPFTLAALTATVAIQSALAMMAERRLGVRRPPLLYPALVALKDVLLTAVWVIPILQTRVAWRGTTYTIGRRTLLQPALRPRLVTRALHLLPLRRAA